MNDRKEPSDYSSFLTQTLDKNFSAVYHLINTTQNYLAGLSKYAGDFMIPYLISTSYFKKVENEKLLRTSPLDSLAAYLKLLDFNLNIFNRGFLGGLASVNGYTQFEMSSFVAAV